MALISHRRRVSSNRRSFLYRRLMTSPSPPCPPPDRPETITNPATEESGGAVARRGLRSAAADWVFVASRQLPVHGWFISPRFVGRGRKRPYK